MSEQDNGLEITPERVRELLESCRDQEFPYDLHFHAVEEAPGRWGLYTPDGDGAVGVTGSLFYGGAEAMARLLEAAPDIARAYLELATQHE